jgi:hypothetical protein
MTLSAKHLVRVAKHAHFSGKEVAAMATTERAMSVKNALATGDGTPRIDVRVAMTDGWNPDRRLYYLVAHFGPSHIRLHGSAFLIPSLALEGEP